VQLVGFLYSADYKLLTPVKMTLLLMVWETTCFILVAVSTYNQYSAQKLATKIIHG
jgi:hypothetical protein